MIDFALMDEQQAAFYEAPFAYVVEHVKPVRASNREAIRAEKWWRLGRPRPELRKAIVGLPRYLVTVETAKHRIFTWLPIAIAPEHKLIVFPRFDDAFFGILSSRFHILWATASGGHLGVGNDPVYSSTRCFETFLFPEGLTPNLANYTNTAAAEIAAAAQALNTLRNNWLNPPEWTDWVRTPEEENAGFPLRPVAKDIGMNPDLQKRTLTNLYNARPTWLDNAHKTLDAAVAKAYGWNDYTPEMTDEEILRRLLALNLER